MTYILIIRKKIPVDRSRHTQRWCTIFFFNLILYIMKCQPNFFSRKLYLLTHQSIIPSAYGDLLASQVLLGKKKKKSKKMNKNRTPTSLQSRILGAKHHGMPLAINLCPGHKVLQSRTHNSDCSWLEAALNLLNGRDTPRTDITSIYL